MAEKEFNNLIDTEAALWFAGSLVASMLIHGAVAGGISLVDHLNWSLRADLSWEVDGAELRQVGLGSTPPTVSPPTVQTKTTASNKKTTSESSIDVPETESLDRALAGKLEILPDDTSSSPPEHQPGPEPTSTPSRESPEDRSPDPTPKDEKESTGRRTDRSTQPVFDDAALRRAGPSNLPRLDDFAPGNTRYTTLIRLDRVRQTRYAEAVGRLFSALPDYRLLAASTELAPIEDLDTVFFASARPRYLQHTFIAIRHDLSKAQVQQAVDSRFPEPPEWTTDNGLPTRRLVPSGKYYHDPRRIVLADRGLTLVSRPEWLDRIASAMSEPPAGKSDGASTAGSLVSGLRRIERVADKKETVVLMSAYGIGLRLPGVGRIEGFKGVRLEIADPDSPTLTIDLHFEDAQSAQSFTARYPQMRRALLDAIPLGGWLNLETYVERLTLSRDDQFVTIEGTYSPKEVERIAGILGQFVPRPHVLNKLPSPSRAEEADPEGSEDPPDGN